MQSPGKGLKPIKEVQESELKKHKVTDIYGFIKSGNLPMVHGLIKHHNLGQSVILMNGYQESFQLTKTDKVAMANWNPLLVAIALKKIDIVRYFLYELKIALRHFGKIPGEEGGATAEQTAA